MIPRHLSPSGPGRSLWDTECLVPELGQTVPLTKLEPSKVGFAQTTSMSRLTAGLPSGLPRVAIPPLRGCLCTACPREMMVHPHSFFLPIALPPADGRAGLALAPTLTLQHKAFYLLEASLFSLVVPPACRWARRDKGDNTLQLCIPEIQPCT